MKYLAVITIALAMSTNLVSCSKDEKRRIAFDELPQTAQTFVQKHFSDKQVSIVYREYGEYEILFVDGAKIEFTRKGEWDEIEDKDVDGIPEAIMLQSIVDYVDANHPNQPVVKINKERSRFEVELSSGVEIVFNKNGNFVRYDD